MAESIQAITLNPLDPEPYYQRAVPNIRRGKQADAIRDLSQAIPLPSTTRVS